MDKVLLTGRLTRDPELRQLASGKAVATFGIATNEYRTGQEKSELPVQSAGLSPSGPDCRRPT